MSAIGVYLCFAAIVLRAAVVLLDRPEFTACMALLACYGLLLTGETWFMRRRSLRFLLSPKLQLAYLFLQSVLVIGVLILSSYEDFIAMLFIPLSLDAVTFFGRRVGYRSIAVFSAAMTITLLFSAVGPLFGLVMGILYSGICFLFGGYAYQVQKANAARDQIELMMKELQVTHRQLQGYADQLASLAVEHERNRLARELHDSVTQTVFSMNLTAQSTRLLFDMEPSRARGQLVHLEELAASAQREIQSLVSQLRPRSIVEEGLPVALRRLAMEQNARNGLQVCLEIQADGNLSDAVAVGLYSIAQEALINVSKHSGTCEAVVRLKIDRETSCLEIEDQGLGFDPEPVLDQRGHLGLAGMFERAHEIGWSLSIVSRPGQGTKIQVVQSTPGRSE